MNDQELFIKRSELQQRLTNYALNHSAVLGAFFGGSVGNQNQDAYSDLDFRLVLKEAVEKPVFLQQLLAEFDDLLFIESQADNYCVVHFAQFVKADIFCYYWSELVPSVWLEKLLIVKDEAESLHQLQHSSEAISFTLTQAEFEFYLHKFYAYYHEGYRRWRRGEANYLQECELLLKHCLISFWYLAAGWPANTLGDWSRYEGSRSKLTSRQQNFITKFTPVNEQAVPDFLREIAEKMLTASRQVSNTYQLKFNPEHYLQVIQLVKERLE